MASPSRISELASIISDSTSIIDNYFKSHGLPTPSFDISGPSRIDFPPQGKEVAAAHIRVLGATNELHRLMQGPTAMLMETSVRVVPSLLSTRKGSAAIILT